MNRIALPKQVWLRLLGLFALIFLFAFSLVSCGGGGGTSGGTTGGISVTGIVLNVETGSPTNPQSSVSASGVSSVLTSNADGSFSLPVNSGTSSITVDTNSSFGAFTFSIPTATATEDVGNLYVGPDKVTITGTVVDASTGNPITGATVNFAGVLGTTNASGQFSLPNVAYPTANFAAFAGIVGSVRDTSYFANTFLLGTSTATNGSIDAGTILLTPLSGGTPPGAPTNIYGAVGPSNLGPGSTVTLAEAGTSVRQVIADSTGAYSFWVPAGTYQLSAASGSQVSSTVTVVVTSGGDVHKVNLTIQ